MKSPATTPCATSPQCSGSALHAHITRAAQLQSAMTDIERNRICRERAAAREFADCMADIDIVTKQYKFLMERLGVGRVG